ncbi:MAG: MgtC/SapB family protein [Vicinamibacterales bacterium]
MMWQILCVALVAGTSVAAPVSVLAQANPIEQLAQANIEPHDPDHFLHELDDAMGALPLAAGLGALLAFRPRRQGSPTRMPSVVQTQILLAVIGAVVMLIVGQSLARAFGIVGVASLIRYRAKIDDPKDAGVMLCCLGVGLASGVGLYALAMFATVFLIVLLSVLEWLQPEAMKLFEVTIKSPKGADLRDQVEQIFKRAGAQHDLRSMSDEEHVYEVRLPLRRRTDKLSTAIVALDRSSQTAVEWKEKKARPNA